MVALLAAISALAPRAAWGWNLRPEASAGEVRAFAERYAFVAYPFPRHGATPLGITGFDVWVDATYDEAFADDPAVRGAFAGDLELDGLAVGRVGARKGLPAGIDLGAALGQAVGSDLELAAVEVQWAMLEGGAISPAVALRATAQRTEDGDLFRLDQFGAELLVSKSFAIVEPYAGVAAFRSRARFDGVRGTAHTFDDTAIYAGVTLNLLLPKITAEVERGEFTQASVRLAFGF